MNDVAFGYFVRGVAADVNLPVDQVGATVRLMVIAEAAKLPGAPATVREPPASMQALPIPPFCAHNINIAEDCAACARATSMGRVFALVLPPTTRVVYTLKSNPPTT